MKMLKISREEMDAKFEFQMGTTCYVDNQDELKQRLMVAGFDMRQVFYHGNDKNGDRIYAQKEHEEENIEIAFVGE